MNTPNIKDNFGRVVLFTKIIRDPFCFYVKSSDESSISLYYDLIYDALKGNLKSALIVIDNKTLEFRVTCENHIICFLWNRVIATNLSYNYYVDSSSPNYKLCDCWIDFNKSVIS